MRVRTGAAARVNACPRAVPALKVPAFRTNELERRRANQEVGTRASSVLGEARIVISAITFSFVANSFLLANGSQRPDERTSFNGGVRTARIQGVLMRQLISIATRPIGFVMPITLKLRR